MTGFQQVALAIGAAGLIASLALVAVPAFVRFPATAAKSMPLFVASAMIGVMLVVIGDRHAASTLGGAVRAFHVYARWMFVWIAAIFFETLLVLPIRIKRGWSSRRIRQSRVMYTVDEIGSRITGSTAQDGAEAVRLDAAVRGDGLKAHVAKESGGYCVALTKRGWLAYVSECAPSIDEAAALTEEHLSTPEGMAIR